MEYDEQEPPDDPGDLWPGAEVAFKTTSDDGQWLTYSGPLELPRVSAGPDTARALTFRIAGRTWDGDHSRELEVSIRFERSWHLDRFLQYVEASEVEDYDPADAYIDAYRYGIIPSGMSDAEARTVRRMWDRSALEDEDEDEATLLEETGPGDPDWLRDLRG